MPTNDEALLRRLRATFRVEAQEHIQTIASAFIELEKGTMDAAGSGVLDTTLRAAHSLKGAARAVNASDIEALCQPLESVLAAWKRQELHPSAELFDLLHRTVDALSDALQKLDAQPGAVRDAGVTDLIHSLNAALVARPAASRPPAPGSGATRPAATSAASAMDTRADTIRVATARLDAVMRHAEELIGNRLAAAQQTTRIHDLRRHASKWRREWTNLRPELRTIRQAIDASRTDEGRTLTPAQLRRLHDALARNEEFLGRIEAELSDLAAVADREQRALDSLTDGLLDEVKKLVMEPFATVLDMLPRLVRDIAREQRKDVALRIEGAAIEIDRRILEQIKDPLIHLVRNCMDHGIEPPAIRVRAGKPPQGRITISVTARGGGEAELVVADDGSGIDAEKVRSAAVRMGLISPQASEQLSDAAARSLVFASGLSTAPIITDLSGRGVGLAVVKERVERLNGTVSVESTPGAGTRFRILLPVTLARFRGVLVRSADCLFVVPSSGVERAIRVKAEDIRTIENRATIELEGHVLAAVGLADALELPARAAPRESNIRVAAVLTGADQRIAFLVDEVVGEYEVLVKPLSRQLARLPIIAGATVLGTGEIAPVLNVPELMRAAIRVSASSGGTTTAMTAQDEEWKPRSILVAEDSITSRDLLKNILEAAGYRVETAVDGIDAYTCLKTGNFDVLVSDVEMPRMNGFDLTARIRADRALANLPVVLVTALDSREDRERGIEVGANAYIVKNTFDQGNLLQVLRQLA